MSDYDPSKSPDPRIRFPYELAQAENQPGWCIAKRNQMYQQYYKDCDAWDRKEEERARLLAEIIAIREQSKRLEEMYPIDPIPKKRTYE